MGGSYTGTSLYPNCCYDQFADRVDPKGLAVRAVGVVAVNELLVEAIHYASAEIGILTGLLKVFPDVTPAEDSFFDAVFDVDH